jgi:hypothetical protein
VLFGSYRRGDANDPDSYVAAIAAVLALYDAELMREVTDPRTGIATTEKFASFMPNAGELKIYCDGVVARRDRLEKLSALPPVDFSRARLPRPAPAPGDLAKVFVPSSNIRYAALVEWSKTAGNDRLWKIVDGGIWVALGVWDRSPVQTRKTAIDPSPNRLALSQETLRMMREVDAERYGELPIDMPAKEAAE